MDLSILTGISNLLLLLLRKFNVQSPQVLVKALDFCGARLDNMLAE